MMTALLLPLLLAAPLRSPIERPRLLVVVVIDQFVPTHFERLEPALDGGLGRLWREGLVFTEARLPYAATETGPGHATIATGCLPRTSGITGNLFLDRGERRVHYCVSDRGVHPVPEGTPGGGISPANLRVPTLGDRLRASDSASLVFSVSGKDRAATCLGGRLATAAVWWDSRGGGFVTSSAWGEGVPEFVRAWNGGWRERAEGWRWEWSDSHTPESLGAAPDQREGEVNLLGQGSTFPYDLGGDVGALPGRVMQSPLVDRFTCELARAAVDSLDLGADEAPDLLALSLSACDIIGHADGPRSEEVTDLLLRADDALGELFDHLDQTVGEGRWVAAMTADHGVLPLPESVEGGRRITRAEFGALEDAVRAALEEQLGESAPRVRPLGNALNLDPVAGVDARLARALAAKAASSVEWVAAAYTYDQLLGSAPPPEDDPYWPAYLASFDPLRCPDVLLRLVPRAIYTPLGTTHGSPYEYDQRIPLIFLGPGFSAEHRGGPASSADLVPTLLGRVGIGARGVDGRDLLGRD